MSDQYAGQGGSYVADESGNRVLVARTGMEQPVAESPAPKRDRRKPQPESQEID